MPCNTFHGCICRAFLPYVFVSVQLVRFLSKTFIAAFYHTFIWSLVGMYSVMPTEIGVAAKGLDIIR
jgi:hypothetical protein